MESPYSWNVRYTSALGGFPCQLTVRSETSDVLLEKIGNVEKWLVASGATPAGPETPAATAAPVVAVSKQEMPPTDRPLGWCVAHDCQMTLHNADNGRSWFSHKVDEGWCRGKKNGNGR
jgi:hypothetical protein